jgi:acetyl-CoA synthetase
MLPRADTYEAVVQAFRWEVPEYFNMGVDVCDRWADTEPNRLALLVVGRDEQIARYSFGDLQRDSNRLANVLGGLGVKAGERVAILLGQSLECGLAHIATYKLGAIAVPLFSLFGVDALRYRLADSGAVVVVTDRQGASKLDEICADLPELRHVITVDGGRNGSVDLHAELTRQSDAFRPAETLASDPALIIYTSGTTGPPKGALHAHRVLLGHLPGVEISHDFFPEPGDRIWTPADWAWIGGLIDVLLPAWHHGVSVVSHRMEKFDPAGAFKLMADLEVRNAFLPPTALKLMRTVDHPERQWRYQLRSVASGGETLGAELLEWGRQTFGLTINEFYGQTECNMIVSSCSRIMPNKPGVMGRPVPGHDVAVIDDRGRECPVGQLGQIAVRRPDPVMFLEYWNQPQATDDKFIGHWMTTGDQGERDDDGFIRFVGRNDDVINSAGYRIGPGEIEDCLLGHPAVKMAAAVGVPDELRGELVKAFIVLDEGFSPSEELVREIQDHVRSRLAAHEYPREIQFIEALPLTVTGKVIRRELRNVRSEPL